MAALSSADNGIQWSQRPSVRGAAYIIADQHVKPKKSPRDTHKEYKSGSQALSSLRSTNSDTRLTHPSASNEFAYLDASLPCSALIPRLASYTMSTTTSIETSTAPSIQVPTYIPETITFPGATVYRLLQPITELRSCHDGEPAESRIIFICHQISPNASNDQHILKIKVQIPGGDRRPQNHPHPGPSTTTAEELRALSIFTNANVANVPHLLAFTTHQQPDSGPLPGGYITYTLMTLLPGQPLFNYWSLPTATHDTIRARFLEVLKSVYAAGVEPADCGLRNVMWDEATQQCGIIDLEIWREADKEAGIGDETKELQRWGLARRPPGKDWWAEWNTQGR